MNQSDESQPPSSRAEETGSGRGEPPPGADPARGASPSPGSASPADLFAAVRSDFDGLEEVCRWQWNLIRRLRAHLSQLPADWPAGGGPPDPPGGGRA